MQNQRTLEYLQIFEAHQAKNSQTQGWTPKIILKKTFT